MVAGREVPELGGEEAAKAMPDVDGDQTGAAEGVGMIRQVSWLEAGQQAEGEIERTHEQAAGKAKRAGRRDAEV